MLDKARGDDAEPDYRAATDASAAAQLVVARRASGYRFPLARLTGDYDNETSYPFGYLRAAQTLCYWSRNEQQVRYLLDQGSAISFLELPSCQD